MELKDYLKESFTKEYGFRLKFAADCGADHMDILEKCLAKYNIVSISPFKRSPIEENPMEFVRAKGVNFTSEVCTTDVVLKYPVHERILEVWCAVNLGLPHERVLVYGVKEPRRLEADNTQERTEFNKDRQVSEEDAILNNEDQSHYEMQNEDLDDNISLYGEEYNQKFLDELQKIKDEKGAEYFTNFLNGYPTKDELSGDNLRPMYDTLTGQPNMGKGAEQAKEVDRINQHGSRSR